MEEHETRMGTHIPTTDCWVTSGTAVIQIGINLLYWHSLQEETWHIYFTGNTSHTCYCNGGLFRDVMISPPSL